MILTISIMFVGRPYCMSYKNNAYMFSFPNTNNVLFQNNELQIVPSLRSRLENIVLCSNECATANDGVCDDVSHFADTPSNCSFGTDCADCGPRGNYPYDSMVCSSYNDNNIDLDDGLYNTVMDGTFCYTSQENKLNPYNRNLVTLMSFGNISEACRLTVTKDSRELEFKFTANNEIYVTDQNGATRLVPAYNEWYANESIYVSTTNYQTELNITDQNGDEATFYLFKNFISNQLSLHDIKFDKDVARMKTLYDDIVYIPYHHLQCVPITHAMYSISENCVLNSSFSRIYDLHYNEVTDAIMMKPPSYPQFVPVSKKIEKTQSGFITTKFKEIATNRIHVEFYIETQSLYLLEMYGFEFTIFNMNPVENDDNYRSFCSRILSSLHDEPLRRKTDVGNLCVWTSRESHRLINLQFNGSHGEAIYFKIPASLKALGPASTQMFLFGVEMNTNDTSNVSLQIHRHNRYEAMTFLISKEAKCPSSDCILTDDPIRSRYLCKCKTQESKQFISVDIPELVLNASVHSNASMNCMNNTMQMQNVQFGTLVNSDFIAFGPTLSNFACMDTNILYGGAPFDVCDLIEYGYVAKVNNTISQIQCCRCSQTSFISSNTSFNPPLPPFPPEISIPPLLPNMPQPPPSPLSNEAYMLRVSSEDENVLMNLQCDSNLIIANAHASFTSDVCSYTNCSSLVGNNCHITLNNTGSYRISYTSVYANFAPLNFTCILGQNEWYKQCSFVANERQMFSPPPPPHSAYYSWKYTSIDTCESLLDQNLIDSFIVRATPINSSKLVTSVNEFSLLNPSFKTCKLYTQHSVHFITRNVTTVTLNLSKGYQTSPIANWTNTSVEFDAYINNQIFTYPGSDLSIVNYKSFLMYVKEDWTGSLSVRSN